jgi:myosin heavy subunit
MAAEITTRNLFDELLDKWAFGKTLTIEGKTFEFSYDVENISEDEVDGKKKYKLIIEHSETVVGRFDVALAYTKYVSGDYTIHGRNGYRWRTLQDDKNPKDGINDAGDALRDYINKEYSALFEICAYKVMAHDVELLVREFGANLQTVKGEISTQQTLLGDVNAQIEAMKKQKDIDEAQMQKLESEKKELESKLAESQKNYDISLKKNALLESQMKEKGEKLAEMEVQMRTLQNEKVDLIMDVGMKKNELLANKKQINSLTDNLRQMISELARVRKEIEKLTEKNQLLQDIAKEENDTIREIFDSIKGKKINPTGRNTVANGGVFGEISDLSMDSEQSRTQYILKVLKYVNGNVSEEDKMKITMDIGDILDNLKSSDASVRAKAKTELLSKLRTVSTDILKKEVQLSRQMKDKSVKRGKAMSKKEKMAFLKSI